MCWLRLIALASVRNFWKCIWREKKNNNKIRTVLMPCLLAPIFQDQFWESFGTYPAWPTLDFSVRFLLCFNSKALSDLVSIKQMQENSLPAQLTEQPLCYLYPATKRQRSERTEGHSHFQALKRWPWPHHTCGQHYKALGHCFSGMDGPWLTACSSIFSETHAISCGKHCLHIFLRKACTSGKFQLALQPALPFTLFPEAHKRQK